MTLNFLQAYLLVASGIVISVLLPIVRQLYPKPSTEELRIQRRTDVKRYVALGIGSLLTALLVVAFTMDSLTGWKAALLAGYAWDSTLQKIGK
jgi:hypothetical protein